MSEDKQETTENHVEAEEKEAKAEEINDKAVEEEKPKENGDHSEENGDDGESSDEEELAPGSLEGPIAILSGKRERKSTSRLSIEKAAEEKKKAEEAVEVIDYTAGKGMKLGDIPYIVWSIDGDDAEDLKPMHKLLYFTKKEPTKKVIREEIKAFQGYPFDKTSKPFKQRHGLMYRFTIPGMRYLVTSFGLEWKKQVTEGEETKTVNMDREEMIDLLIDFLMEPKDMEKRIPKPAEPAKKKTPAKKKATPKKPSSAKKATPKPKTPKTKEGEEGGDDESASKKKKSEAKKKPVTQVKIKSAAKKSPSAKKAAKRKNSDDTSDEDEPLGKKSKKKEPTNDEVRKAIKGILKDADLEQVTMKTVCKQVYDMYPDFDMTVRKDFIKTTVKEIIS